MSTDNTYDTVVVGGGHNTLVTAAYLAKAGHSVLVLEKNAEVGGGAFTQEVTQPGFKHELHGIAITWLWQNPLHTHDELGLYSKHGLEVCWAKDEVPVTSGIFDDGEVISIYHDLDKTCQSIARYSAKDAQAYRKMALDNSAAVGYMGKTLFAPPLPLTNMNTVLDGSSEGREMMGLLSASAYDIISSHFENPYVRSLMYRWLAESTSSPDAAGTGVMFTMMVVAMHQDRMGMFKGGNQNLAFALVKAIESYGGEVRTNALVNKFNVSGGRINSVTLENGETFHARKSVVAGSPPWALPQLIDGLDKTKLGDIDNLKNNQLGIVLAHYALNEAPRNKGMSDEVNNTLFNYYLTPDLDRYRNTIKSFEKGTLPDYFTGQTILSTHIDTSRAPAGKHVLYFYHFVPPIPLGRGVEHWSEIKEQFGDWMLEGLQGYTDNMDSSNILGSSIESPYDMQLHSPSFRNGDVTGIGMLSPQLNGGRPTPELSQYRVPGVEGLYLSGPCMHPGGGIIGGGRPVAMRVMMDQNMDLKTAFEAY